MSGADDLRTAIAQALRENGMVFGDDDQVNAVLAFVADPVRRLAILNLIGDVTEVTAVEMEAGGPWWHEREPGHGDNLDGYVVRPRGVVS